MNDDELEDEIDCFLREIVDKLVPYMKTGFPDWDVPVLDPLRFKDFERYVDRGPVSAGVEARINRISGLSSLVVTHLHVNLSEHEAALYLMFPLVSASTDDYQLTASLGKIITVRSKGRLVVSCRDAFLRVRVSVQCDDQEETAVCKYVMCDFGFKKLTVERTDPGPPSKGRLLRSLTDAILAKIVTAVFDVCKKKIRAGIERAARGSIDNALRNCTVQSIVSLLTA